MNCPGWVRVEGWIDGGTGAVAEQGQRWAGIGDDDIFEVARLISSSGGYFLGHTKHWYIYDGWFSDPWYHIVDLHPDIFVYPYSPPPDPAYECALQGGQWNSDTQTCDFVNCPLLVDTAHNGYHLTSVADGARFDLDGDGTAEQVAWTKPGSDDAFLAVDRNGNGRIDDGTELLGNRFPAYSTAIAPTASNGFEALKFAEGPTWGTSVSDLRIDAQDAIFSRLLLWRDHNHNGVSEPEELEPVTESDLVAIDTTYKVSKRIDRHGNEFRQRAVGTFRGGTYWIYDVWLRSGSR